MIVTLTKEISISNIRPDIRSKPDIRPDIRPAGYPAGYPVSGFSKKPDIRYPAIRLFWYPVHPYLRPRTYSLFWDLRYNLKLV